MIMCHQECASIEVEEHTGCVCGCDLELRAICEQREELVYKEESCQCQCRDIQVRGHMKPDTELGVAFQLELLLLCSQLILLAVLTYGLIL